MSSPYPWQSQQWQQLQKRHQAGAMPHALLLHGPEGIGKADFAQTIARSLLCEQTGESGEACGQCKSCQLLNTGNHPDFIHIQPEEAGKAIKVDQIRELIQQMGLSHHLSTYRVVLITQAEQMNLAASNSLLKTLEEPQANTIILLVCSKISRLPATIRSRCQKLRFSLPSHNEAIAWLQTKLKDQTEEILTAANGAPLLAVHMFEADILKRRQVVLKDLLDLLKADQQPLAVAANWYKQSDIQPLSWLYYWVCDLIRLKTAGENYVVDQSAMHQLQTLLKTIDLGKLYQFHDQLGEAIRLQQTSANGLLLLEGILLSWTYLATNQNNRKLA
ncbi:MAG: DNA polymerase III subunit delta' [Gammaproteobacteria bacterium]|nr:DNA polymerase III subunit delta' [Gammaproteobacteria bacterium]